jgi:hypothetical protein
MTSSQHGLDAQGDTHATMAGTMGCEPARGSQSQQTRSQWGLQAATRLHERGVASNRRSAHGGECVPGSCTHRPSRPQSGDHAKPVIRSRFGGTVAVERGTRDGDEVVTR